MGQALVVHPHVTSACDTCDATLGPGRTTLKVPQNDFAI